MSKQRGRPKKSQLNEAKSEEIEKSFLQENPEGLPSDTQIEDPIVIAKEIPKYQRKVFINGRDPGCALAFHYATGTHPIKQYTLLDGFEYELPEEVINHLESCREPIYAYRKGQNGLAESYISSYKYIFSFRNKQSRVA